MLLSIIIPAYNAEKYVCDCLDSCLNQCRTDATGAESNKWLREDEVEIIVVDDGSTDNTPTLLAQYARMHTCISVLTQRNQGQSVARNAALEVAKGDYVYMVDSDDRMVTSDEGCVLPLQLMREGNYDIMGLQVWYQPEAGERRTWSRQMERWPYGQTYETAADFVKGHNIEGLVYGYVFRRSLFAEHRELRFTPGIYHQDEELIFKLFTLAGKTIYVQGYTYIYYEHTGSSLNTKTAARKRKLMDDHLTILRNLCAWRERWGEADDRTQGLRHMMRYKMAYLSMDMLRLLIRGGYESDYIGHALQELRGMGLYPLPHIGEWKYAMMKLLTCHPQLVKWWARHGVWNKKIGF